jgi:hypothetical protein
MADLPSTHVAHAHTSTLAGAVWMVVISLLLFFLPAVNGFIAGIIGGYMVGSLGRALIAALLPALIIAGGLWGILAVLGLPVVGFLAGTAVTVLIALSELGLFLGATIGALMHGFFRHSDS